MVQNYPYIRILFGFSLTTHMLMHLYGFESMRQNLMFQSLGQVIWEAQLPIFLGGTLPMLILAVICCAVKCKRWQWRYSLLALGVTFVYGLCWAVFSGEKDGFMRDLMLMVYPIVMTIYAIIVLQWFLPPKNI